MIVKSFEIKRNLSKLLKYNLFLLYGENFGLKKEIKELIKSSLKKEVENLEIISLFEDEIKNNDDNLYNSLYSGSLFSNKKIITIHDGTDKLADKINDIHEKNAENSFLIIFSELLDKKSKLRTLFEKSKKAICIPCYPDNEKDLRLIADTELKKNNINISPESINLLIEKSNADRNNLRNEIDKIVSYSLNKKKIEFEDMNYLTNFSGDYKFEIIINECLCGNTKQYGKIISELYANTINYVLYLRILSNKIQRLLKIKEQENKISNIDNLISSLKPAIFWKEKPMVKQQLTIWNLCDLKKIIGEINNTELLCKKNPKLSNSIFFNFLNKICEKANSFS